VLENVRDEPTTHAAEAQELEVPGVPKKGVSDGHSSVYGTVDLNILHPGGPGD
jgi:hypothetical protein